MNENDKFNHDYQAVDLPAIAVIGLIGLLVAAIGFLGFCIAALNWFAWHAAVAPFPRWFIGAAVSSGTAALVIWAAFRFVGLCLKVWRQTVEEIEQP